MEFSSKGDFVHFIFGTVVYDLQKVYLFLPVNLTKFRIFLDFLLGLIAEYNHLKFTIYSSPKYQHKQHYEKGQKYLGKRKD